MPIGSGLRSRNGLMQLSRRTRRETATGTGHGAERQARRSQLAEPEVEVAAVGRGAGDPVELRRRAARGSSASAFLPSRVLGGVQVVGELGEAGQVLRQVRPDAGDQLRAAGREVVDVGQRGRDRVAVAGQPAHQPLQLGDRLAEPGVALLHGVSTVSRLSMTWPMTASRFATVLVSDAVCVSRLSIVPPSPCKRLDRSPARTLLTSAGVSAWNSGRKPLNNAVRSTARAPVREIGMTLLRWAAATALRSGRSHQRRGSAARRG